MIPTISCFPLLTSATLKGVCGATVREVRAEDGGGAREGLLPCGGARSLPVVAVRSAKREGNGVDGAGLSFSPSSSFACDAVRLNGGSPTSLFSCSSSESERDLFNGEDSAVVSSSPSCVSESVPLLRRRAGRGDEVGGGGGRDEGVDACLGGRVCLRIARGVFSFTTCPMRRWCPISRVGRDWSCRV